MMLNLKALNAFAPASSSALRCALACGSLSGCSTLRMAFKSDFLRIEGVGERPPRFEESGAR